MKTRAVLTIALRRSNGIGGHYFIGLYSGKQIHRYKWEKLPIDEYVIARVEDLAAEEEQPIMYNSMPSFEWTPGVTVPGELGDETEGILTISRDAG